MLVQFLSEFQGDNILINIQEVDHGRLAPQNVLTVIMGKTDQGSCILATRNEKI